MFNGADVLARPTTQTTAPNMPSMFAFCGHTPNTELIVVRHRRCSSSDDLKLDGEQQQHKQRDAPSSSGASAVPPQSPEKVRTKLMSVWNNVRYGWTMRKKANFSDEEAIWLLGIMYHRKIQTKSSAAALWSSSSSVSSQRSWSPPESAADDDRLASYELFLEDFSSRLWFTYRREFPAIPGTDITSDCGWGCMLRSSQMMLAQAILTHFLGRSWRYRKGRQSEASDFMHRTVV
ncbi:hypothetical protein V5799_027738, partial [Amblyomma americanum]